MYYNDYEDYMRSVLGYSNMNDNTYGNSCGCEMNYNNINYGNMPMNQMSSFHGRNDSSSNIEQMYPEIYKVINPMVCRMCDNNTQPVTEYLIEQMTDDIYDNVVNRVEIQNIINLNIGTRESDATEVNLNREESSDTRSTNSTNNTNSSTSLNRNNANSVNNRSINSSTNKTDNNAKTIETEERETRSPQPRRRNRLLRDLIRILILNRLLRSGRPNRPPFIQAPGPRPVQRPPMPRYDNYYVSGERNQFI